LKKKSVQDWGGGEKDSGMQGQLRSGKGQGPSCRKRPKKRGKGIVRHSRGFACPRVWGGHIRPKGGRISGNFEIEG